MFFHYAVDGLTESTPFLAEHRGGLLHQSSSGHFFETLVGSQMLQNERYAFDGSFAAYWRVNDARSWRHHARLLRSRPQPHNEGTIYASHHRYVEMGMLFMLPQIHLP
jgi:hypothetical protein